MKELIEKTVGLMIGALVFFVIFECAFAEMMFP